MTEDKKKIAQDFVDLYIKNKYATIWLSSTKNRKPQSKVQELGEGILLKRMKMNYDDLLEIKNKYPEICDDPTLADSVDISKEHIEALRSELFSVDLDKETQNIIDLVLGI